MILDLLLLLIIILSQNLKLKLNLRYYSLILILYGFINQYIKSYFIKNKNILVHLKKGLYGTFLIIVGILINNFSVNIKNLIENKIGISGIIFFEFILFGSLLYILKSNKKMPDLFKFDKIIQDDTFKEINHFLNQKYASIQKLDIKY